VTARGKITTLIVLQIFLLFFQGFMIAPLLPRFAAVFATTVDRASILVPAYTLPYGVICLVIGPLADRHGRARVMRWLIALGVVLPILTTTATSLPMLVGWRIVTGLALGGIAPIALAMIATMYPYEERGRPVGWVFGAIAGGMALGATCGPWLEPTLGWRGLFALVSALDLLVAIPLWRAVGHAPVVAAPPRVALAKAYVALVSTRRGATLYAFIFLNGAFHSGVFSWLGVYFTERYHLAPRELGLALLGYGIPGFLLGPVVGKLADRFGRRGLIRTGLTIASLCALALVLPLPVVGATATITVLSFGFDLSHPLFAGMVTALDPVRTAQAMALNTFAIFVGFGTGSILFGLARTALGMSGALIAFACFQMLLAAASLALFDRTWR
jgi:predicted MFS family arabinose efflux permease